MFRFTKTHRNPFWPALQKGRGAIPITPRVIFLAAVIGVVAGYGAMLFTILIESVTRFSVESLVDQGDSLWAVIALCFVPALGLLLVSWFTRTFAPEAQGHGVPEVIVAVGRNNGKIRSRVSLVKILASALTIGTGGSVGREGPIVQIGSSLGSLAGQLLKLPSQHVKVLVAAGAAAGISATFNAPIAGVVFASEIILGNFAVGSMTPIVIAAVIADVIQAEVRSQGFEPAFPHLDYVYHGAWEQLPSYLVLGLIAGLVAVSFSKFVYASEDFTKRWLPKWWVRALVMGLIIGVAGVLYPSSAPVSNNETTKTQEQKLPPLFGVGYGVVEHALHLQVVDSDSAVDDSNTFADNELDRIKGETKDSKMVKVRRDQLWAELIWILPLVLLKPIATSFTLSGGGSGGIFAPSLFTGATLGAAFGLVCNMIVPSFSANPGVYAIVGMGAVVAGTTHGVLSAILIVYELTNDYRIILPIMMAAGLASVISEFVDPDSIYLKKLSRRGESITRGHELHRLEHVMVRDVMVRDFPIVRDQDNLKEIIRVARAHTHLCSLPVTDGSGKLTGIIHAEDLHHAIESDAPPELVLAEDVASKTNLSVMPDENLLEAIRDFGMRDTETLPVQVGKGENMKLVGLLLRSDVMRRYRQEILQNRAKGL